MYGELTRIFVKYSVSTCFRILIIKLEIANYQKHKHEKKVFRRSLVSFYADIMHEQIFIHLWLLNTLQFNTIRCVIYSRRCSSTDKRGRFFSFVPVFPSSCIFRNIKNFLQFVIHWVLQRGTK